MKNITPRRLGALGALSLKNMSGLLEFEAILGVTHSTLSRMTEALEAAEQSNMDYWNAKTDRVAAVREKAAVQRRAFKFIMMARDLLRQKLGTRYSEGWGTVGFINKTLKIPALADGQLSLLQSLELYFAGHPENEVAGLVDRAMAAELLSALGKSIHAVNTAWCEQRQLKAERNVAVSALRQRVQNLYAELKMLMPKDDPRWLEFGFNVPGDKSAAKSTDAQTAPPVEVVPE